MNRRFLMTAIASAMVGTLAASAALAQPTVNPRGNDSIEMDHSRMGGPQRPGQTPSGPAPTVTPRGNENMEMDHSRMGGRNMGGPTPSVNPAGEGVELTHPGNPGTGHGHEQGRQQRR